MTSHETRYLPSLAPAWVYVIGDGFLTALPCPASMEVIEAVRELAGREDTLIEQVVSVIPYEGREGDPAARSFAVVAFGAGDQITAVVGGRACVDVVAAGEVRRFQASGGLPWLIADFRDVTGLILSGGEEDAHTVLPAGSVPAGTGVVLGDALGWSAQGAAPASAEDTIVLERRVSAVDEETVLSDGPRRIGTREPRAPRACYSFVVAGEAFPLDVPALIGRKPRVPRVTSGPVPRLVTVESAGREVSATHLRLQQEGEWVVATDLRSTNGTSLAQEDGSRLRIRPGDALVVGAGARIDIGDGNIVRIMPRQ